MVLVYSFYLTFPCSKEIWKIDLVIQYKSKCIYYYYYSIYRPVRLLKWYQVQCFLMYIYFKILKNKENVFLIAYNNDMY